MKPGSRMNSALNIPPAGMADVELAQGTDADQSEHRLDPLVKARLANIVQRYRRGMIDASRGGRDFGLHDEIAFGEFDQKVIALFLDGLLQFQDFLLGCSELVEDLLGLDPDGKETVLGLEQSVLHLRQSIVDLDRISGVQRDHAQVVSGFYGASSCGDQGKVHASSCDVNVESNMTVAPVSISQAATNNVAEKGVTNV